MNILRFIAAWAVPVFVSIVLSTGFLRKVKIYDAFIKGARQGLETSLTIAPILIAMFIAIGIIRQSGALSAMAGFLSIFRIRGLPPEIIGLALLRPFSGSGSLALLARILKSHGPDSFAGLLASILQGTTETTFYVLTVYFGAVKISETRHCLLVGLGADLAAFITAFYLCRLFFG